MSAISKNLPTPPDNFSTTLSSGISDSDLSVPLNSVANLPTEGVGVLFAKDANGAVVATSIEFIHWTNISGSNLTLTDSGDRGLTGSASGAQAHASGRYFEVWVSSFYYASQKSGFEVEHAQAGTHAAAMISGRSAKTSLANNDLALISDSADSGILKKITWANIVTALNALFISLASGGTLGGELNLGENAGLFYDEALSADGKYSGLCEAGIAGAALAFGQLCYFSVADSRWELADANLSASYDKKLGICILAANADGDATKMLRIGKIRADAQFPDLTPGAPIYMAETAGAIIVAQPTTADVCIRVVGFGNTANELDFNPSPFYIVHV